MRLQREADKRTWRVFDSLPKNSIGTPLWENAPRDAGVDRLEWTRKNYYGRDYSPRGAGTGGDDTRHK